VKKQEKSEKKMKRGGLTPGGSSPYGECALPEEADFPCLNFSGGQVWFPGPRPRTERNLPQRARTNSNPARTKVKKDLLSFVLI
jgi:hypothetical protein